MVLILIVCCFKSLDYRNRLLFQAFKNSLLLFLVVLHLATIVGLIGWIIPYSAFDLSTDSFYIGLGVFAFIFVVSYLFLVQYILPLLSNLFCNQNLLKIITKA